MTDEALACPKRRASSKEYFLIRPARNPEVKASPAPAECTIFTSGVLVKEYIIFCCKAYRPRLPSVTITILGPHFCNSLSKCSKLVEEVFSRACASSLLRTRIEVCCKIEERCFFP